MPPHVFPHSVHVADTVDEWLSQALAYTGDGILNNPVIAWQTFDDPWECRLVYMGANVISSNARDRIYIHVQRRGGGYVLLDVYNYQVNVVAFKSCDTRFYLQPKDIVCVGVVTTAAASYYHATIWFEMRRRTERVSAEYTPSAMRDIPGPALVGCEERKRCLIPWQ